MLSEADAVGEDDLAVVADLGGSGVTVLVGDPAGRLRARRTT